MKPVRFAPSARGQQVPLPFPRRRAAAVVEVVPESEIQAGIVQGLRTYGYTVHVTSARPKRVRCEGCGSWFWPAKCGTGATPGTPDLLVRRDNWPRAVWLGVEIKGEATRLSPEQRALSDTGAIVIARSFEEALAYVRQFEEGPVVRRGAGGDETG